MKTKIIFYSGLLLFLLSGCAFHSGMMTGNANLSSNNFKVVKQAHGYSKTVKFLGIGGLGQEGLVADARQNLYNSAKLEQGQALANVAVDFKTSYLLLFSTTEVFVVADIVDFNLTRGSMPAIESGSTKDTTKTTGDKNEELKLYDRQIKKINGLELGETVKFKKGFTTITGKIVELRADGAYIEFEDMGGKKQTKFVPFDQIHKSFK